MVEIVARAVVVVTSSVVGILLVVAISPVLVWIPSYRETPLGSIGTKIGIAIATRRGDGSVERWRGVGICLIRRWRQIAVGIYTSTTHVVGIIASIVAVGLR